MASDQANLIALRNPPSQHHETRLHCGPDSSRAGFMGAIYGSGYLTLVKVLDLVSALLLLSGRYINLALTPSRTYRGEHSALPRDDQAVGPRTFGRHRCLGPRRPHRTEELPQDDLREVGARARRGRSPVFSWQ